MDSSIYHQAILAHAKASVGAGRLNEPAGRATVDNPLCGDRVTVELTVEDGIVTELAHQVRGCLLCQASASVLAQHAQGHTADEIRAVERALTAMVKADGPTPGGWDDLAAFSPVRDAKSRHECVLLPFRAATEALDQTGI